MLFPQAFWASLVIGVFLILAFSEQTDLEGLYVMGTLAYLVLVNCMLYKAMLEMSTINFWSSLSIFISLAGTLFFVWGYSFFAEYAPAFYNVGIVAFNHSMFWLVFITVPIITGVFDLLVAAVKTFYFPDPLRIAMEIDHLDRMERRREGLPEFGYGEGEDEDDEDDGSREEQQEGLPESAPTFGTTSSGDNVARALESEEVRPNFHRLHFPSTKSLIQNRVALLSFSGSLLTQFATMVSLSVTLRSKVIQKLST
jgi:hypothetical protein